MPKTFLEESHFILFFLSDQGPGRFFPFFKEWVSLDAKGPFAAEAVNHLDHPYLDHILCSKL